jgi:hypothetical protein
LFFMNWWGVRTLQHHADTLRMAATVGELQSAAGQLVAAEATLQRTAAGVTAVLGENHPVSAASERNSRFCLSGGQRRSERAHTPSWVYRRRLTGRIWYTARLPHGSSTHSHTLRRVRKW